MHLFEDVTGVILAGGKSSRFGPNKAFAMVEGTPLIERVLTIMRSLFQRTILITNTPDEYSYLGIPIYQDIIKGLGPLGGIYTGLTEILNEAGFFVACDMPSLNPELIRHLVEVGKGPDVVVPRIDGKLEALHALYSKRCKPEVEGLIEAGIYQVIQLFPRVSVRHVDDDELREFDPGLRSFFNVNRPRELEGFVQRSKRENGP